MSIDPIRALPVTAAIITRNEERHIARCLELAHLGDEILVVDAESTDRTARDLPRSRRTLGLEDPLYATRRGAASASSAPSR